MNYLCYDLETGGLDKHKHTITEAFFAIWDEEWNLLDTLHLYLKNDAGEVIGEEAAWKMTGIDPDELLANPDTITYSEGREKLLTMLKKHKIPRKRNHYQFLGQNIAAFDGPFMEAQGFLTQEHRKKAGIHHNVLDTTIYITWLKKLGILPATVGSLGSLVEYFDLQKREAHRAEDDVYMQKDVYIALCDLIKQMSIGNLNSTDSSNDLLKIVEL